MNYDVSMLTLIAPDKPHERWLKELRALEPDLPVSIWPDVSPDTEFALCWNPPEGVFDNLNQLKCICSMGAGVDHILKLSSLPEDVPIVRLVDPSLNQSMLDYVLLCVSQFMLRSTEYQGKQSSAIWQPRLPRLKTKYSIGIMGLGSIGDYLASSLADMGYQVKGWSKTQKTIDKVETFEANELGDFISQVNVLMCVLPLTTETEGILNEELLMQMPEDSCLINVARGAHLDEADLLRVLEDGPLVEAYLDVFRQEPLPEVHPFWQHEKIHITPHVASLTHPRAVAPQVLDNYHRALKGQALTNQIDPVKGY